MARSNLGRTRHRSHRLGHPSPKIPHSIVDLNWALIFLDLYQLTQTYRCVISDSLFVNAGAVQCIITIWS